MRRSLGGVALCLGCGLAHGLGWTDLWLRPEQQTIAQRQQAYAEMQGQQFAAAAGHLQGLDDPVSQYNRGNALAHTGDLKGAISAYDAVLHGRTKDDVLRADAQHNRDLVEQQMKSQPQSGKSGSKGDQKQQNDKSDADSKNGEGGKPSGDPKDQEKKEQHGKGQSGDKQGENTPDNKTPPESGPARQPASQSQSPDASQAQASQREAAPGKADASGKVAPAGAQPGEGSPPPKSEQAQSMDQWLRWIPDDPAGLLRRKFMIEHMRHQDGAPQ